MSGAINFKGVEEAKDTVMTPPGTIDVFDITEVKFDTTTKKGTYYAGVTFARPLKGDRFSHSFFLTEKALGRLKALVHVVTGKKLEEEIFEDQLKAMLESKKVALKVSAKIDRENGKAYADLSFGGAWKAPEKVKELSFTDQEEVLIREAKEIMAKARTSEADGAPSTTASAETASAPKKEEDIF